MNSSPKFKSGDIIHVNKGRRSTGAKKLFIVLEVLPRGFYKIKTLNDIPARTKLVRFNREEYYTLFIQA